MGSPCTRTGRSSAASNRATSPRAASSLSAASTKPSMSVEMRATPQVGASPPSRLPTIRTAWADSLWPSAWRMWL